MEIKLISDPLSGVQADALASIVFDEGPSPAEFAFAAKWFEELRSSGEFRGKPGDIAVLHQPQDLASKRFVAVGGGKREKFDAAALRKAVATTVRELKQKGVKTLAWQVSGESAEAAA